MNMNLNEKQKAAVEHKKGALLIIAGAGTGKTAVITQRILNIIKKGWAKPSEILALTFLEKAAEEMQSRVDEELPLSYGDMWISTFHSFCDRILRQEGHYIGIDTDYVLMSQAESNIFFRRAIWDLSLKRFKPFGNPMKFVDKILDHFSRLQDEDISPEEYLEYANGLVQKSVEDQEEYKDILELATVFGEYTKLKIENSKLDFGDLIILTIRLFREKPNILKKYREKFKYILVDEYQDTNHTQNVLVNILSGFDPKKDSEKIGKINPNLTVVGDDDQAIYKFRGAAISNILQFKKLYPRAKEIVLTENYRSRQEILDSAYTLIRHNNPYRLEITEKIEKRLQARAVFEKDENPVQLLPTENEDSEAQVIAEEILKLTGNVEVSDIKQTHSFDIQGQSSFVELLPEKKYKFSDIAILVRANAHMEAILQNLRYKGIPYKLGGSRGLYMRGEIRRIIAFLRVLVDYKDEESMYTVLAMNEWGVSAREFLEINMLAKEKNISVWETLENFCDLKIGDIEGEVHIEKNNLIEKVLSESAITGLEKLLNILNESIKMVRSEKSIGEILYYFVTESGYLNSFVESKDQFKVNNISKFFTGISDYEKKNVGSNIYEYVDFLNYSIDVGDSPQVDQSDLPEYDAVNILTVHGSKGLEFPVVFLVSLVTGRFPSQSRRDKLPIPDALIKESLTGLDENEEHIQEERRLFYVGATRAKEKLYLTASTFYGTGKRRSKGSIFLHEILDRDVTEDLKHPIKLTDSDGLSLDFVNSNEDMNQPLLNIRNERFSYSQIDAYMQCPLKYYYMYVLKIPPKPNAALSFGTTVHNALRDFYTLLKNSQEGLGFSDVPSKEDLLDAFEKHWVGVGYQSKKHEQQRKDAGKEMMESFYTKIFDEKNKPYLLEEKFTGHVGDSLFVGKIDRVDVVGMDGEVPIVDIIDYKTGHVKSESEIRSDLQLPLYVLFSQMAYGFKVRNAKYIFVEHGEEKNVDISTKKIEKAKEKLVEVIEKIVAGEFKPPRGHSCMYCESMKVYDDLIESTVF